MAKDDNYTNVLLEEIRSLILEILKTNIETNRLLDRRVTKLEEKLV